jgi:hypothetical protein
MQKHARQLAQYLGPQHLEGGKTGIDVHGRQEFDDVASFVVGCLDKVENGLPSMSTS